MVDLTESGVIKWFNASKERGYGFIILDGQTEEIFVHCEDWRRVSIDPHSIKPGDRVRFTTMPGKKGRKVQAVVSHEPA